MSRKDKPIDPVETLMPTLMGMFQKTAEAILDLRKEQEALQVKQQQQAQAAYQGMTGSGKSRYVAKLVEFESESDSRGAQTRVADLLKISPARVSQLLHSDKNRANGK